MSPGIAQTSPAPEAQFRVVSMSDVETVLFDLDKEQEVLIASVGTFSRLYPAPKDGNVVFYKETPNPESGLPPIKTPLAKSQLPSQSVGPYLILLIPNNSPNTKLKFKTVVLDHSLENFPANTYRVYNYSKRQLAVRLAEANLLLSTAESGSVPYPDGRKAWLKVAANDQDEGWLVVRSAPQPVGSNTRTTVFLVDIEPSELDPNPLGIMDRRIRERIFTDDTGMQHLR
ncbi:MAG: hypothetical protein CML13_03690 [Puniceicoccaceae bacterium]|nr:hypothetical protein [Puniceicoccaceae bacterium]